MSNCSISFNALKQNVLDQLGKLHYKESTITNYSRIYNRVWKFMQVNGIQVYTAEIGKRFLESLEHKDTCLCPIRRLNDFIDGEPYRCHHSSEHKTVPYVFSSALNSYVESCEAKGNSPYTVSTKKAACIQFLRTVYEMGCSDFKELDAQFSAKALTVFSNKDKYAIIRSFMMHIYNEGYLSMNLSSIVPNFRRRIPVPTVYTVLEMIRIEAAVDTATRKGVRDIAMIRLATRMGLRAGDIANLKWDEINFFDRCLKIIQEKTKQALSLVVPDDVYDALCLNRQAAQDDPVFDEYVFHSLNAPYGKATTSIIRHIVNEYMTVAGIDTSGRKHGPHAFRSSLASSMVNEGCEYETVRRILGHSDPDAIKHYAKADIEKLRACAIDPPVPSGRFAKFLSGKKVQEYV